jgi:transcription termination/antitermination protein NusA
MTRVKLNLESFAFSSIMERIAKARVKGSFQDDSQMIFVAYPGTVGKVVGKGGENVKKAQIRLDKKVRVVEFNNDCATFVRNLISPLDVESVEITNDAIVLKDSNKKTKSLLIGRDAKNLKLFNSVTSRFFGKKLRIE